jgi:2'-5' RNA ligase
MRLFIAIEIPEDVKDYLARIQEKICNDTNKIGYVNKNQIHLTLKFLGEVQPDKAEKIKNILKKIKFGKFSVYLDSIGVFPSESYIRVVWVGLKPEKQILELQKDIDEKLKGLFKKEKAFKAHVTLARVKYIEDKERFIIKLKNIEIENKNVEMNNFKLMKSTLTPEGPVYEDLEVFS